MSSMPAVGMVLSKLTLDNGAALKDHRNRHCEVQPWESANPADPARHDHFPRDGLARAEAFLWRSRSLSGIGSWHFVVTSEITTVLSAASLTVRRRAGTWEDSNTPLNPCAS